MVPVTVRQIKVDLFPWYTEGRPWVPDLLSPTRKETQVR